jgi:hypothetical protein
VGDECDELPEHLSVFFRVNIEYLPDAVVVIPLLEKLFLVGDWIALYEVLKLWKI